MRHLWLVIFFGLVISCSKNTEQTQEPVNTQPETESPSPRNSPAIEPQPPTEEDAQRTEWQNPQFVLQTLGDLNDKVVADLGAGSGYFSFKIAQSAKKVIALDIDPRALDYIREQKQIVGDWSKNIEPRLTPADVPNLLDNEVDIVLIVNTYAFIPDKEKYLPRVLDGIRSGGKLAIVDFKTGAIPVGPSDNFKMEAQEVVKELRKAGFKRIRKDEESLQYQYIVTAEK